MFEKGSKLARCCSESYGWDMTPIKRKATAKSALDDILPTEYQGMVRDLQELKIADAMPNSLEAVKPSFFSLSVALNVMKSQ